MGKKIKPGVCDLDSWDYHDEENSWWDLVDFSKVPIVSLASDEKGHGGQISFRTLRRHLRLAEYIKDNAAIKFGTVTDVHRASYYLGQQILYHKLVKQGSIPEKGRSFYALIRENEERLLNLTLLEEFKDTSFRLWENCLKGFISLDEFQGRCKGLIDTLPEDVKDEAQTTVQNIKMAGFKKNRAN